MSLCFLFPPQPIVQPLPVASFRSPARASLLRLRIVNTPSRSSCCHFHIRLTRTQSCNISRILLFSNFGNQLSGSFTCLLAEYESQIPWLRRQYGYLQTGRRVAGAICKLSHHSRIGAEVYYILSNMDWSVVLGDFTPGLVVQAPSIWIATPLSVLLSQPWLWNSSILACYQDIGSWKEASPRNPHLRSTHDMESSYFWWYS